MASTENQSFQQYERNKEKNVFESPDINKRKNTIKNLIEKEENLNKKTLVKKRF